MEIYTLDEIVTDAYLKYKHTWMHDNFEKNLQLISNSKYEYEWEEGENWAILSLNSKAIAMLCVHAPFMITDDETLQQRVYGLFPFVLTQKVMSFAEDKIILNPHICKLTIAAHSELSREAMSLNDFYVSTV